MLNSLNSCGQTLLDTINHVMDHSKMSETARNVSSRRLKNTKTVRLSSKPLKTRRSLRDPAFDLGIATEEVVEAVFAGSSFLPIMSSKNAPVSPMESISSSARTEFSDVTTKRKTCYIILDVAHEQDWIYCFPVGSWKRTVMKYEPLLPRSMTCSLTVPQPFRQCHQVHTDRSHHRLTPRHRCRQNYGLCHHDYAYRY
jgi:hypothetical protein